MLFAHLVRSLAAIGGHRLSLAPRVNHAEGPNGLTGALQQGGITTRSHKPWVDDQRLIEQVSLRTVSG